MKLYVVCSTNKNPYYDGAGEYILVAETGEFIDKHFCSSNRFARKDLCVDAKNRIEEFLQTEGSCEILLIGEDDMTRDRLMELNRQFYKPVGKEIIYQNKC